MIIVNCKGVIGMKEFEQTPEGGKVVMQTSEGSDPQGGNIKDKGPR